MRGSVFFLIIALIFVILTASAIVFNLNKFNFNQENKSSSIPTGNIINELPSADNSSNTSNSNTANTTFKPSNPKTYNVEITNFAFSPSELKIKKGDSVIWVNRDYTEHTITSDSGELDSGYLKEGKIYDHVFNTPGTFEYYCSLHPSMTGKIIVE